MKPLRLTIMGLLVFAIFLNQELQSAQKNKNEAILSTSGLMKQIYYQPQGQNLRQPIIVNSSFRPTTPDSVKAKEEKSIGWGYGLLGVYIILPSPFLEGCIHMGQVDLRGNFAYNLAYLDIRIEIAVLNLTSSGKISLFFNSGYYTVVQSGEYNCYALGFDINSSNKKKWFAIQPSRGQRFY